MYPNEDWGSKAIEKGFIHPKFYRKLTNSSSNNEKVINNLIKGKHKFTKMVSKNEILIAPRREELYKVAGISKRATMITILKNMVMANAVCDMNFVNIPNICL